MEDMQRLLTEYIEELSIRPDVSDNTVVSYERDLRKLFQYLDAQGIHDIAEVTEMQLKAYLQYLEEEHRRPSTISRSIASMRAFFKHQVLCGVLRRNPADQLKAPRVEKAVPHILTPEEVVRLLQQPAGDSPKAVRDRAMLEVLYATGVRVSELVMLRLSDVNLTMEFIVCSQGGRERVVPFGKSAKAALQKYIAEARPVFMKDAPDCDLLFVNMSGQQMSRQGFWKLLKQYGKEAGIEGELSPHTLRHSFAAHLVNNGADLFAVQEMMGYTDLSATQVYAQMHRSSIREVYTRAHPREK